MLDDDAAVSHPADTVLVSLLTHRSLKRGDFSHSGFVSSSAARATGPGAGRVKVVVRSADGGELTLTVIAPGGVFGELSAADGGPRSADAEILEDCRLLFVPHEVIQDLCGRAPSVAQALASSLAASLRRLTEEASDLVFLDLPHRVAKVLLSQPRDDDGVIGQKMTQEEFAHRVGGARQSVNAALRGFERRSRTGLSAHPV